MGQTSVNCIKFSDLEAMQLSEFDCAFAGIDASKQFAIISSREWWQKLMRNSTYWQDIKCNWNSFEQTTNQIIWREADPVVQNTSKHCLSRKSLLRILFRRSWKLKRIPWIFASVASKLWTKTRKPITPSFLAIRPTLSSRIRWSCG